MDAFATLELPRRLCLTSDEISAAYHRLSRLHHPDSRETKLDPGSVNDEKSSVINQAYEILRRPASRLQHRLKLEGLDFKTAAMSAALMDLFPAVGEAVHRADAVLKKKTAATTALGKAVLAGEELAVQKQLQSLLARIQQEAASHVARFPEFDGDWSGLQSEALQSAAALGFLQKWERQVNEKLLALVTSGL